MERLTEVKKRNELTRRVPFPLAQRVGNYFAQAASRGEEGAPLICLRPKSSLPRAPNEDCFILAPLIPRSREESRSRLNFVKPQQSHAAAAYPRPYCQSFDDFTVVFCSERVKGVRDTHCSLPHDFLFGKMIKVRVLRLKKERQRMVE